MRAKLSVARKQVQSKEKQVQDLNSKLDKKNREVEAKERVLAEKEEELKRASYYDLLDGINYVNYCGTSNDDDGGGCGEDDDVEDDCNLMTLSYVNAIMSVLIELIIIIIL